MDNNNPEKLLKNKKGEKEVEMIRCCDNCDEQFDFNSVKNRFPPKGQEQLKKIWFNPEVHFYCTSCYFLKLIRHLRQNKLEGGDKKESLESYKKN